MNSLFTIAPTRTPWGTWCFDDPARGLKGEPFVGEINDILDHVADGATALEITFSADRFPGWQLSLERVDADACGIGTDYHCPELGITGWLCPALFKYFPTAPQTIYAQFRAQPKQRNT